MKLRACFTVAIVVVLVSLFETGYGADTERERGTLKGLKGIYVLVESINTQIVKDGLSETTIRTDAELKLRLAGIRVLPEKEWSSEVGMPFLYISAHVGKWEERGYIYSIFIQVKQGVSLLRSPNVTTFGTTWDTEWLAVSPDLNGIRDDIKDRIDGFINAYLSVNPKK
jgi:hypothetical protein